MSYQDLIISKAASEAKRLVPEIEYELPTTPPRTVSDNRPRFVYRGRNDGVSGRDAESIGAHRVKED